MSTTTVHVSQIDFDSTTGILYVPVNCDWVTGIELAQATLPSHGQTAFRGSLTLVVDGTTYSVTLEGGQYTSTTYAEYIEDTLNAALAGFTVSFSETTEKFTISHSTDNFTIQFRSAMLAYQLGFGTDVVTNRELRTPTKTYVLDTVFSSESSALTSPYGADFVGARYLECWTPELGFLQRGGDTKSDARLAIVSLAAAVNVHTLDTRPMRYFQKPISSMTTLPVNLSARMPTGELAPYEPRGRAFDMYFTIAYLKHGPVQHRMPQLIE